MCLPGWPRLLARGRWRLNVTLQNVNNLPTKSNLIVTRQHNDNRNSISNFAPGRVGEGSRREPLARPASRPPQATVQRMHVHTVGVARSHPLWPTAIHFDLLSSPALQWLGVGGRALLQHGGDRPRELRLLPAGLDRTRSPHFAPAVPRDSRAHEVAAAPTSQAAWRRRRGVQPTLVRVARRGERFPRRG